MKKNILALLPVLLIAASTLFVAPSFAQSSAAPAMASDQLYQTFGGKPGLVKLMDDFMVRLLADPRTGPHFKPADQKHVKEQLVDQFCKVTGGPCEYKGADMKSAHSNLDITKADFNALVEVLQLSMDAQGIAFSEQNKLLAKLAPMHRDVITVE
jgi:hemoglobin